MAQIRTSQHSIDRRRLVAEGDSPSGRSELNVLTGGEFVAAHGDGVDRHLRVDVLCPVLVAHASPGDRKRRDEKVEWLPRSIRTCRRMRKVVPTLFVDEVVDVDVFECAGLYDVAAAQQ